MAKIYVSIKLDGEIVIKVEGVKGKKCLDVTKELEEAIGGDVKRKFTSDYYDDDLPGVFEGITEKG